jgi:hypothetical protein
MFKVRVSLYGHIIPDWLLCRITFVREIVRTEPVKNGDEWFETSAHTGRQRLQVGPIPITPWCRPPLPWQYSAPADAEAR